MTDPVAERPARRGRTPGSLVGLAAVACLACCLLPTLIAAGLLGGALATGLVAGLPAVAAALGISAVVIWRAHRSRTRRCGCDQPRDSAVGCSCRGGRADEQHPDAVRLRSRP
ncbi:mercuric ion transport protein [Actinopolyspora xinjiangensis]|uniref:Mercuric ion transport protein n=1 Tax=Actinopolyspora xinjiangensis TaxID=405564 RepID=A0A1H0RJ73_9ACTN|nr:hypothetical protein [Actinopolyspora xinjiangensis]SDP29259.1 mercuric ion transport protein [Actinopolyspora xinjiangensis]